MQASLRLSLRWPPASPSQQGARSAALELVATDSGRSPKRKYSRQANLSPVIEATEDEVAKFVPQIGVQYIHIAIDTLIALLVHFHSRT
jgi:hypothetical protein